MNLTYKYSGTFEDEFSGETKYSWDVFRNGVMLDVKRIMPIKDISPDVWDAREESTRNSAQAKLVSLGFTPEEAVLICLNEK